MPLFKTLLMKAWKLIHDEQQKDDYQKYLDRLRCDRQREQTWMHDGDPR